MANKYKMLIAEPKDIAQLVTDYEAQGWHRTDDVKLAETSSNTYSYPSGAVETVHNVTAHQLMARDADSEKPGA